MTVMDLLKQLNSERLDAAASKWLNGVEVIELESRGEFDEAREYRRKHDESRDKENLLKIVIGEIEKRVF